MDAWRRLWQGIRAFQRTTGSSTVQRVLQLKQQSLENLRTAIENRKHEYRQNDVLSDAVRRLTLQSTAPQSLQAHPEFHSNRLSTYRLAKEEIESYLDIKRPAGSSPVDVDALNVRVKGNGKAGVTGWNRDPKVNGTSSCAHCGGRLSGLQTEWDCWCNPKNPRPEARAMRSAKAKKKVFRGSNNNSSNN